MRWIHFSSFLFFNISMILSTFSMEELQGTQEEASPLQKAPTYRDIKKIQERVWNEQGLIYLSPDMGKLIQSSMTQEGKSPSSIKCTQSFIDIHTFLDEEMAIKTYSLYAAQLEAFKAITLADQYFQAKELTVFQKLLKKSNEKWAPRTAEDLRKALVDKRKSLLEKILQEAGITQDAYKILADGEKQRIDTEISTKKAAKNQTRVTIKKLLMKKGTLKSDLQNLKKERKEFNSYNLT